MWCCPPGRGHNQLYGRHGGHCYVRTEDCYRESCKRCVDLELAGRVETRALTVEGLRWRPLLRWAAIREYQYAVVRAFEAGIGPREVEIRVGGMPPPAW